MKPPLRYLLALLVVVALLTWIAVLQMPDGRLHVYFLAADGGQAVLARTPTGRWLLIDGGPRPSRLLTALGRLMPFWQRSLHVVVVTQQADNAVLGSAEVIQRYRVQQALGPAAGERPLSSYRAWQAALAERHVPFAESQEGSLVDMGDGVRLQILANHGGQTALRLAHGEVAVLLPGRSGQAWDTRGPTVLALPFAAAKDLQWPPGLPEGPAALVIFSGQDTSPYKPAPELAVPVFSTGAVGPVELVSDGRRVSLKSVP